MEPLKRRRDLGAIPVLAKVLRSPSYWENKIRTQKTSKKKKLLLWINSPLKKKTLWEKILLNQESKDKGSINREWLMGSDHLIFHCFGFFTENQDENNTVEPCTHPDHHMISDEFLIISPQKVNFLKLKTSKHKTLAIVTLTFNFLNLIL